MRAIVVKGFGGPEVLELIETPTPEARRGQVRIKVAASAVNPVDVATAAGIMHQIGNAPERAQVGIGWDVAGTVDAVGEDVTGLAVGDRVIALLDRTGAPLGAYADYVVAGTHAVARVPEGVDLDEAATIPLPGLTALQALEALDLKPGDTLLVTGAAGGVGQFAVQFAAARAIEVVAQGSPEDEGFLRAIGATHVVHRGQDLGEAVRAIHPGGVDAAIDAAVLGIAALDAVRNKGAISTVVGSVPHLRGIRVHNILIQADETHLAEVLGLVAEGFVRLNVAGSYPLERAGEAFTRFSARGVRGRLLIKP
ncbi:NADPH:quinone reductase [Actinorhabdospora filicis]|uniref:NADPH:quinone reductase n=1 Tax=Actinorhabdospora filicis TaxID=1785913 RepID=A0A9W6SRZ0_9ACTN|nr:NADP-dependent oxidoreductase [Actinorhabdospora filicis]GLZ80865.1 NADPH:quinone reductase [Actinorhabdospora filicis]